MLDDSRGRERLLHAALAEVVEVEPRVCQPCLVSSGIHLSRLSRLDLGLAQTDLLIEPTLLSLRQSAGGIRVLVIIRQGSLELEITLLCRVALGICKGASILDLWQIGIILVDVAQLLGLVICGTIGFLNCDFFHI